MKKLTTSVLVVVLSSTFAVANAQNKDSLKTTDIGTVVVTGALGIKKKNNEITTSNQVVSNEEITKAGNSNAAVALTGKVSGLQINLPNNSVNGNATINIRGQRSITGSSAALVVIDGAPSTLSIFQQLAPETIESINVIKGQQGAALYGQDGANGVIIVTTKRGTKSNKLQFTLTSNTEFSSVYKLPIIQNKYGAGYPGETDYDPTEYSGSNYVAWENMSWGPAFNDPTIGGQMMDTGMPQTMDNGGYIQNRYQFNKNNIAKFFKTGSVFQNGLTLNVGGNEAYAFLSLNRLENDFVVDKDKLTRNNLLFKAGKEFGKLRIDGSFNLIDENSTQTDSNLYDDLIQTPSNVRVQDFQNSGLEHHWSWFAQNPYWTIEHSRYNNKNTTLNTILSAQYNFNDHFNISYLANALSTSSLSDSHNDGYKFTQLFNNTGTTLDGHLFSYGGQADITSNYYKSVGKRFNYYGDLLFNFKYDLTKDVGLKLNLGNNITDKNYSVATVGGTNLQIPGFFNTNNILNPASYSDLLNTQVRTRSVAFFANLDLSFRDYLFLNGTFRYETSSVMSTVGTTDYKLNQKWYPYESVGLSFVPTKAFEGLQGNKILNYAKLTAAFTRVGSTSAVPAYATDEVTGLIPTGYPMNVGSYLINRNPTNPNISPEFSNTIEASGTFGFLKDRVTLGAAVYSTKSDKLITNATTSTASGISTLRDNVGSMTNKGYELELGITPFRSRDFEWKLNASYSTYKSTIDALSSGADEINLLSYGQPGVGVFARVGEEFPLIKGTTYQRDDQGRTIVGANGIPLVNSNFSILGKVNPDYIMGFSTSIRFKGFTLAGTADYRTGNKFVSFSKSLLAFTGGLEETASFDRNNGLIVPNSVQIVNGQSVVNTTPVEGEASYGALADYYSNIWRFVGENVVVDGSAFKIREISLTYDLSRTTLSNTFINGLSIGLYARNPFAWYAKSNRNFNDPETASNTGSINMRPGQTTGVGGANAYGIAYTGQYPTIRNYGINLKVTF